MSQDPKQSPPIENRYPGSEYEDFAQEGWGGRRQTFTIVAWVVGSVVSLGVLLYLTLSRSPSQPAQQPVSKANSGDSPLLAARAALGKQGDLATCRMALQQLNNHLSKAPEHQAPAPGSPKATEYAALISPLFDLKPDDLAEVQSVTFTSLDAFHLETCFLFRDMARSLELPPAPGKAGAPDVTQTPLDRARSAFECVVRQVRLQGNEEPVPPTFVLRRGYGTALERALVFLGMLEQFGQEDETAVTLQGCLVYCPGESGSRLWACGVCVGNNPDALYLFDPRLGLPLPGPGGKGVATLAQVRNDPSVLGQLKFENASYDVTPEQARAAEVKFVCPLSALAPRMALLQNVMLREPRWKDVSLPAAVRVRLREEPATALKTLQQAVIASGGKASDVGVVPSLTVLLRHFLPAEDGGTDKGKKFPLRALNGFTVEDDPTLGTLPRRQLYQLQAVPWENFPAGFRDPNQFRYDVGLGQRLRAVYATPFLNDLTETDTPRDLVLRGRHARAMPELVKELERWRGTRQRRAEAGNLNKDIREWLGEATGVYAQELRARSTEEKQAAQAAKEALWKRADAVMALLMGAAAERWVADLTLQLAVCTSDRAERLEARLDLSSRGKGASLQETDKTRQVWEDAQSWLRDYVHSFPKHPGQPAARRLQARAQAALGNKAGAVKILRDLSGPLSDLDKVAQLWLAKQLEAADKGK